MADIARALLWLSAVFSCHAFAASRPIVGHRRSPVVPSPSGPANSAFVGRALSPPRPAGDLRGGGQRLNAGADYSDAARALFGNVISPAALLAGGLVPLGFLAPPLPADRPLQKKLRCLYHLLSVLSLSNQLMAIVYATVASNKLTETVVAPAASVFELIQRDYELPWIATNVHFMFGLLGFLSMICLRAYTIFPSKLNSSAAGIAGSSLMVMCSVVNRGVSSGDGQGQVFGSSMLSLVTRYAVLLAKQVKDTGGVMATVGIALGVFSMALGIRELFSPESS